MSMELAWKAGAALMWIAAVALSACSGGVSTTDTSAAVAASEFTVGGTVVGLTGSNLLLQNNGGDNLPISADGSFTFATPLIRGSSYSVTVLSQPSTPTQTCVVTHGSGAIGTANVTGVTLTCADKTTTTDTIGGTAVGVSGSGLVLQDNNGDNLVVPSSGPFTFVTPLASGVQYQVSVLTPPINPYQDCAISNGTGTTGSANVTNVAVSCTTNTRTAYTISGSATGISGAGAVVLQDNGRDNLPVSADGPFHFEIPIPSGSTYNVTALQVSGQQSQTCKFTNASGTVTGANVTNVTVACQANVLIAVTVTGLSGTGLVLQDNGGDNLAVANNGPAHFATALATGTPYTITVLTSPSNPTQNCSVTNADGVAGSSTIPTITCTTPSFAVGGTVTGLSGSGLVLQDNLGDNLAVTTNGAIVFPTPIISGGPYSVSVLSQPISPFQTCTVAGGAGTITSGSITSVAIACTTNSFTVGGTVTGLIVNPAGLPPGGLVLQINGGSNLPITASGIFTFAGPVDSGAPYSVTISSEPSGYACAVTNGSGAIVDAAVNNVGVSCSQIGGFLYVTNGGSNNISGFAIDLNTGGLQPLTGVVAAAGQPNAIIAASAGALPTSIVSGCPLPTVDDDYSPATIYVASAGSGIVSGYSVNTSRDLAGGGSLTPINSFSAQGNIPKALDSNETNANETNAAGQKGLCNIFALNDLFPSTGSPSNIFSFTTDASSGALSAVNNGAGYPTEPASTPVAAGHVFVDNDGALNLEFVANQGSNDVLTYLVDFAGELTLIGSQAPPVTNPVPAELTPSALIATTLQTSLNGVDFAYPYVYVANQASNSISAYRGNPFTGLLSPIGTVATGQGPTSLVLLFDLLYATNGVDGSISAYSLQTSTTTATGTLTPTGLSFATGTSPVASTAANVNGTIYLYVVNNQSNDVYEYSVNLSTEGPLAFGALTLVGKFAVGSAPTSLSIPFSVLPEGRISAQKRVR